MNNQLQLKNVRGVALSLAMVTLLGSAAFAQDAKPAVQQAGMIQGMVIGRDGPMMYVKTDGTPRQNVVLSDSTKATEKGGFLGWSKKDLGIEALVPGLEVKVDGTYDADHQLVASRVEFSRTSMKTAKQIDAGLDPVNGKLAEQEDQLASNRKTLSDHGLTLDEHGKLIAANTQAEGEDRQAIGVTNSRIGELDQYATKDTMTVNFANGRSTVKKEDQEKLEEFAKAAADTPGFMIQVQGYASKTGSVMLNQRLSSERADAVLAILQQSGSVPMTRILAPAAMGISDQVADNHTRAGQAQNRRVVVTVLVNKGITDSTTATSSNASPSSTSSPDQAQTSPSMQ